MQTQSLGTYVKTLHKMVYLQNRRFLDISSELRLDTSNFPDKRVEKSLPPPLREYQK